VVRICHSGGGEKDSQTYEGHSMLHTSSHSRIARFASAVRRNWAEARYADRRLMEMRTNLSRHSG
jgi:hypothetical protein